MKGDFRVKPLAKSKWGALDCPHQHWEEPWWKSYPAGAPLTHTKLHPHEVHGHQVATATMSSCIYIYTAAKHIYV